MGTRKYCVSCKTILPSSRRKFCSNYCQIGYYNQQSKPVLKVDKWGRKYLACQHCKRRLRKIEQIGKIKFECFKCDVAKHHKPFQDSVFMKKTLRRNKQTKEIILEITKRNRNWHYLNGRPVRGFKNAMEYFRAVCHRLEHRDGYIKID